MKKEPVNNKAEVYNKVILDDDSYTEVMLENCSSVIAVWEIL
jgi:hypothetical protein